MDLNIENKTDFKNKIINFYNRNKLRLYIVILFILLIIGSTIFIKQNNEKKNIILAEKYIKAGVFLATNENENAKNIYEEIIKNQNKFYSLLALNTIIEKNLETDKNKILKYFSILEDSISNKDHQDLLTLKKALYLIKESNSEEGFKLLNNLIDKNSVLKLIAQDILSK